MQKEKQHGGILVAVDFSSHSREAVLFAANLADCMHKQLTILHVIHDPGEMPGYYADLVKKKRLMTLEDMATDIMDQFISDLITRYPECKPLKQATKMLVTGLPVTRIIEIINDIHPYQVVMGSQGRSRLEYLMLGSKAEQVLRLSPVPVTIVKSHKVEND